MLLRPLLHGQGLTPCRLVKAYGVLTSQRRILQAKCCEQMSLAKVDEARYGEQLSAKADKLREKFADFSLPELEVFDSQTEHYRMR